MIFPNREDAGRPLPRLLGEFAYRSDVIVLGIPRGGVTVAFEIAQALHTPLDVLLSRKLGVPGHLRCTTERCRCRLVFKAAQQALSLLLGLIQNPLCHAAT